MSNTYRDEQIANWDFDRTEMALIAAEYADRDPGDVTCYECGGKAQWNVPVGAHKCTEWMCRELLLDPIAEWCGEHGKTYVATETKTDGPDGSLVYHVNLGCGCQLIETVEQKLAVL